MSAACRGPRSPAALALIALLATGCGASAPGTTSSATTTTLSGQEKAVKFAECVRSHGVSDFPDPNAKGEFEYGVSVSPAVFKRATDACKRLEPPGALSAKRTSKQQTETLRLAACIRAHGVKDFPDPVNGEPAIDTTKIPSTDKPGGMTILNAAIAKCHPGSGPASGGSGG